MNPYRDDSPMDLLLNYIRELWQLDRVLLRQMYLLNQEVPVEKWLVSLNKFCIVVITSLMKS